jgi:hypothetical protein
MSYDAMHPQHSSNPMHIASAARCSSNLSNKTFLIALVLAKFATNSAVQHKLSSSAQTQQFSEAGFSRVHGSLPIHHKASCLTTSPHQQLQPLPAAAASLVQGSA